MNKHLIALATAAFLAGCGGGSDEAAGTTAAPIANAAQLRSALAAAPKVSAAVSPTDAAEQLMDFAENSIYAVYFPGHPPTESLPPFRYRAYANGIYLGVVVTPDMGYTMNGVYVMGGEFGPEPVFVGMLTDFITPTEPGPGPGDPTGPNNGCYDMALHDTTGTHIVVTMQVTGTLSTGTQTMDWQVKGPKTFEGHNAIETAFRTFGTLTTAGQTAQTDITVLNYGRATGAAEFTSYGAESTLTTNMPGGISSVSDIKTVYTPPWVSRIYGLAPGQSVTESETSVVTTTTSFTIPGLPPQPPTTTSDTSTTTQTTKFVAREQVTVPAGTYNACKFEMTTAGTDGLVTNWVIDGKGIPLKTVTTFEGNMVTTQQATSIKLNGQNL